MKDLDNIYTVFTTEEYVHADGTRELLQSKIAESISLAEAKELQDNKLAAGIVASICPDGEFDSVKQEVGKAAMQNYDNIWDDFDCPVFSGDYD